MQHIVLNFNIIFFKRLIINCKYLKLFFYDVQFWTIFLKNRLSLLHEIQDFRVFFNDFFHVRENLGR